MTSTTATAIEALRLGLRQAVGTELAPPARLTVPQWADEFRRLSKKSSARAGRFRTRDVEVARGPMHAATEPGVRIITLMTCRQTLKTTMIENTIGRFAHIDPCPILVVYPKDDASEGFSKERLSPMIEVTPVLRERFGLGGRSDNTVHYKAFPGGFVAIVSAGSPMDLAMRPVRVTCCDEVDKYEPNKEGDPISQAEECTSSFKHQALNIRACSPTWEETSRIYRSYLESDQRRAFVSCPKCGHWFDLNFFEHVHWEKRGGNHLTKAAAIFCPRCPPAEAEWSEGDRLRAIGPGRVQWRQCATFVCCGEGQDPRLNKRWHWDETHQVGYALCRRCGKRAVPNYHAGFTCSKLFNPSTSVIELATRWVAASKSEDTKQTFVNSQLGLPYKASVSRAISASVLADRAEDFSSILDTRKTIVPADVCVLTAGADVQPGSQAREGRIEVEVVGWGLGEESWSLAYEVFTGDPSQPGIWAEVDKYLADPWQREDGHAMTIRACCIDSGGLNTEDVYKFARTRITRNVWAIKGASDRGGQWSPVWPQVIKAKRQKYRVGHRPIIIGVNAAKEAVRQRLLVPEPGPGFCHFPNGRPESYYAQLTAENLTTPTIGGVRVRKWVLPKDRANEALDCRVYAYAALCGLYVVRRFDMVKTARMIAGAPAPIVTPPAEVIAAALQRQERVQPAVAPAPAPRPRAMQAPAPRPHRNVRRGIWRTR